MGFLSVRMEHVFARYRLIQQALLKRTNQSICQNVPGINVKLWKDIQCCTLGRVYYTKLYAELYILRFLGSCL